MAGAGHLAEAGRWIAMVFAVAVLLVTILTTARVFGVWPDERMPAGEAAKRLQVRLGVSYTFTCEPATKDETIPADIDYLCMPSDRERQGYFIETDDDGIELVTVTG